MTQTVFMPHGREVLQGRLDRRYKRFFADVWLDHTDELVTAHTPNTGSMAGLIEKGAPVLVTHDPSPNRSLAYTLQAIKSGDGFVGCNTHLPNRLVARAIEMGRIDTLRGYETLRREVRYGEQGRSRIDLLLEDHNGGRPRCWVEVKNVTLRRGDVALFPDAVSARGAKHLEDLMAQVETGERAAMVYLVQRTDCSRFAPAVAIDPVYAETLRRAMMHGVETYALQARVDLEGVWVEDLLPVASPETWG